MSIVIVTAVAAERDAVAEALADVATQRIGPFDARVGTSPAGDVVVVAGGVGPAAAAAAAASLCAHVPTEELVSMGVGGAYTSARLSLGDVVVATTIVAADLGAMSPERFLDLNALGLDGAAVVACDVARCSAIRERLLAEGLHVVIGPVLTLSTATGTEDRAAHLMSEHGAVAEAMEGAGVAHVAVLHGIPVAEVRVISNQVGDRDHSTWDLQGAVAGLTPATRAVLGG